MLYIICEGYRRFIQLIFGAEIFSFPILQKLRGLMYKTCYKIGKSPTIEHGVRIARTHGIKSGRVTIGDRVTLGHHVYLDATGTIEIGDYVTISANTTVFSHSHPPKMGWARAKKRETELHRIVICDDALIYANVTILPSVHYIGKNAIIGAGSVVTHDVPDYTVVAGNPASEIKKATE